MSVPKFDESELEIVGGQTNLYTGRKPGTTSMLLFNAPVTAKEGVKAMYRREPVWQITTFASPEMKTFTPSIIRDSVARGIVLEGPVLEQPIEFGGKDMFGVEWEYDSVIRGSTVRPGNPLVQDANELKEKVVWPDLESWDWETSSKINQEFLDTDQYVNLMFFTGFFERLISFMDFEEALVSLIDESQKDAVKEFFDDLADFYIRLFDKVLTYFPQVDGFSIHDDWGAENNSFFSPQACREMIVPAMRKVTDFLHSKGRYCDMHSCGKNQGLIECYIAAGWDSYTPQDNNDLEALYDNYGDKILIATLPERFDPDTTSEEEQREIAKRYAEKYCNPDKPSTFSQYTISGRLNKPYLTQILSEEVYKQSRMRYSREND